MISLWARVTERDVEAYLATLVLPSYLSHLCMVPLDFTTQIANSDGSEPLIVTYQGQGRLEEFCLGPREHALPLVESVCPGIESARVRLPQDDAQWYWSSDGQDGEAASMRVYFAPTSATLNLTGGTREPGEAYVSVSRSQLFLGATVVRGYLEAWLARLGVEGAIDRFDFVTPSGEVAFRAGPIEGELVVDEPVTMDDLINFAGLRTSLAEVEGLARLALSSALERIEVFPDGFRLPLDPI